jgi:uncharacterized protein with HEPN domain
MQRREKKLLHDMLESARAIEQYIEGVSESSFNDDGMVRDAVYYKLVIVGEALSVLSRESPAVAERVTDWRKIIGFRNQIVHGYSGLVHEITYRTLTTHLPVLVSELTNLLAE